MKKLTLFIFFTGISFIFFRGRAEPSKSVYPYDIYEEPPKGFTASLKPFFSKMKLFQTPQGSYVLITSDIRKDDFPYDLASILASENGKEFFPIHPTGLMQVQTPKGLDQVITFDNPKTPSQKANLFLVSSGNKLICEKTSFPLILVKSKEKQAILKKAIIFPIIPNRDPLFIFKFKDAPKYVYIESSYRTEVYLGTPGKMKPIPVEKSLRSAALKQETDFYLENGDKLQSLIPEGFLEIRPRLSKLKRDPVYYVFANGERHLLEKLDIDKFNLTQLGIRGLPQKTQYQPSLCFPEMFFPITEP